MGYASLDINADVLDVGHFEITIAQTGPDTASLDVREWKDGADPTGEPTTDNTYDLDTIRVTGEGLIMTAYTSALFQRPLLTFTLAHPTQIPSIHLFVTHMLFAPSIPVLPLSADDYAKTVDFIKQAGFPLP